MKTSFFVAVALIVVGVSSAAAQSRSSGRYTSPSGRPTVSPYINLFRPFSSGGVPNYYTLVRPQLDQQQINRRTSDELQQQSANLGRLQHQVIGTRTVGARPTGVGASFMTHSAYYDTRR